ncbi:hypothetical protein SCHPADRAFT_896380 [Schizopora paradoxa]|uniref:Uncharacterized protein n=1 Tax=Schizopora paradoxa TaxID=27342 RepID=A0A0H2R0P1_9AGAM|nr:hypothetical protein SCHPADRAFT_896380 [Schizopora paradoxa]
MYRNNNYTVLMLCGETGGQREQVLALAMCTDCNATKTRNDCEMTVVKYMDFVQDLKEAGDNETDYELSVYAETLKEKYDVVVMLLEPTKDINGKQFSYLIGLMEMLEQHISVWPPVHEHKMMLDKLKVTR